MDGRVNTIADIAKMAGVSKSTVSRALNDSPLIGEETKRRISEIARKSGFALHEGARSLSLRKSNTLALIIPMDQCDDHYVSDPFFIELLKGITMAVSDFDYDLLISQPRERVEERAIRYLRSRRADGLILLGCKSCIDPMIKLFGREAPIIVWNPEDECSVSSVDCDNRQGGVLAARRLAGLGKKRLAFIGGLADEAEVGLRLSGFREGLGEFGLELDPGMIAYGDYSSASGFVAAKSLLGAGEPPDGIFVCSDLMAIGVLEALREANVDVPGGTAVIGFDDIALAAHCSPPLTTIRQNILKAGDSLVRNLLAFLKDGVPTRTILPVELVVRKSG